MFVLLAKKSEDEPEDVVAVSNSKAVLEKYPLDDMYYDGRIEECTYIEGPMVGMPDEYISEGIKNTSMLLSILEGEQKRRTTDKNAWTETVSPERVFVLVWTSFGRRVVGVYPSIDAARSAAKEYEDQPRQWYIEERLMGVEKAVRRWVAVGDGLSWELVE